MSLRSRLRSFTSSLLHRSRLDSDMESEFRFHFESYVEQLAASGIDPAQARRRARLELGSLATQKENCLEPLGMRLWDELLGDIRFGWRMLRKNPAFATIAVLSQALGIGVNTVIFTLAKAVLLDRLEVSRPGELRLLSWTSGKKIAMESLWGNYSDDSGAAASTSFSYPVYIALRDKTHMFEPLVALKDISQMTATVDGQAESISGELVSGNFFDGLRITPQLGREISTGDDQSGKENVAVLSDAYWTRRFGRSPAVLGKIIDINLLPVVIIGINPPSFTGARMGHSPDIFMPISAQPTFMPRGKTSLLTDTDMWWVQIMGRVKPPGHSDAALQSALDVPFTHEIKAGLTIKPGRDLPHIRVLPRKRGLDYAKEEFIKPLYVMIGLVVFVLLIACANLANLLLARSAARQREMSVRIAMGAERLRVFRQVMTESLLLSLLSGGGGVLLGYFARNVIPQFIATPWRQTPTCNRVSIGMSFFSPLLSQFSLACFSPSRKRFKAVA